MGFVCAILFISLTLREQPMIPSHDGGFVFKEKGIDMSYNKAFLF
jgi:hypothetical protein